MKPHHWLLLIILAIGTVLRFYGFPNIPFTYDELSAWGRTGYSYFYDLINQGVRGDGHPALIQVFLNYWRMIFGDSEAAFKLPFLIMGVVCIWLVFEMGRRMFNETVGIISASFIAVLQYSVMYSQIARPYISGLFFSLLMVHYWWKYVFEDGELRSRKHLALFALFATLCCYNHYFSLLFAFVVGVSGFFFLPTKFWTDYVLAAILVTLLFLPHFGITMDQFAIGGVGGWLAKPDSTFFASYFDYVFDFSWWVKGLVLALIVLSIVLISKDWKQKNKLRLLCLAWFAAPLLIGYFYSRYKDPVLQYSVLIFMFPFLLFLLFSFFRNLKVWQVGAIVLLILSVGSYSLIFERMHYRIFYNQPVEQMVKASVEFEKNHPGKKIVALVQEPEKYMGYYLKKWNSNMKIYSWNDLNLQSYVEARKFLSTQNADYVLCGNVPYDDILVVKNFYPTLIQKDKGFTYEFFSYAKENSGDKEINDVNFSTAYNFTKPGDYWKVDSSLILTDTTTKQQMIHFDSTHEFGCEFEASLQSIMKHRDDILQIDFAVDSVQKNSTAALVVSFDEDGKNLLYQEKPFSYFIDTNETSGHLVYAIRLRDFEFSLSNPLMKVYVWNKNHNSFNVQAMKVEIQNGNPIIYSMIEPIPAYFKQP